MLCAEATRTTYGCVRGLLNAERAAVQVCWRVLSKLPFNEIYESWQEVAKPFNTPSVPIEESTDITSTLSREGLYFPLEKHYGVDKKYWLEMWGLKRTEQIAVNCPFEESYHKEREECDLASMDNLPKV